jgi:hypothetical protein
VKQQWLDLVLARDGDEYMFDPRCGRELLIRGGITTIMVAIAYFILNAQPWVWLIPVGVSVLVCIKWVMRPRDLDEDDERQ